MIILGIYSYRHDWATAFLKDGRIEFAIEEERLKIQNHLKKCKLKYKYYEDIEGIAAELLADGNIIGWFQGKMEIGPRALGNRSILMDPSIKEGKNLINMKVKNREWWRPFALSILEEYKDRYLVHGMDSPFMILIDKITEDYKNDIYSGIHIDNTTRPQTVNKKTNELIKYFGDETGIYAILNTSFNLAGEPIMENPMHAINDFFNSGMDYLILGNYLVSK